MLIQLSEALEPVMDALLAPLYYPWDPTRRIFILFLFSALLIAFISHLASSHHQTWQHRLKNFWLLLTDKNSWWSPSSRLDFQLMLINQAVKSLMIAPVIVGKLAVIVLVSAVLRNLLGSSSETSLNVTFITLLFTACIFLVEDFSRFFQHWCMHKFSCLWVFHKVHHTAETLTPLTLYRSHPVEIWISSWRNILVLGSVTGLFVYLFPGQITGLEILGVDALGFIFNFMGANLRHSPFKVSFGKLDRWMISPLMHQIHHSNSKKHVNKNFGSCFTIWDKLWGSLYLPTQQEVKEKIVFGCDHLDSNRSKEGHGNREQHHGLYNALWMPFIVLVNRLLVRNKLIRKNHGLPTSQP